MTASPESNNELFVGLITANYDHLRRYIYTLLPHEEDSKDVLQEVCLALSRRFHEYDLERVRRLLFECVDRSVVLGGEI